MPEQREPTEHFEEIRRLQQENEALRQERDLLKEQMARLLLQPGLKFQFIADHQQQYPIALMCRVLSVSESGYYAWRDREPSLYQQEDARLTTLIQQMFFDHGQRYGSPRIHAVLQARGIHCSRKRVARLMRQLGLSADSKHAS